MLLIYFKTMPMAGELSRAINVCLSVCLSADISETTHLNFTKFSMHVACGRSSTVFWQHCNISRTFSFVDDDMSSYNGLYGCMTLTAVSL